MIDVESRRTTGKSINSFIPVLKPKLSVGESTLNLDFTAIFDTGTLFTYLNEPAYTLVSESFNSRAKEKRRPSDPYIPFKYCYDLSFETSTLNLTMKGGYIFSLADPVPVIPINVTVQMIRAQWQSARVYLLQCRQLQVPLRTQRLLLVLKSALKRL
ncbi:hypothetical protein CRG98_005180 [Punica granatum]|uniref:Xylanase inhibitor C-terminal domain-containing protein n=1 Tax=Punica granatum TaxID=22663 RepID=A0A2I0L2M7_PUNGR|nr:hypothetical protein CRG98_005180 [Punica granatum]